MMTTAATLPCVILATLALLPFDGDAAAAGPDGAAWVEEEFAELKTQISARESWNMTRLEQEAQRLDALIFDTDKTPFDVVKRRSTALLHHLQSLPNAPDLHAESIELGAIKDDGSPVAFRQLAAIRRRIAFKNPLLDFDRILFLKHNKQVRGDRHMVDQYFGFNAEKRGGVYVLENPFGPAPSTRPLVEKEGAYISLDLDYDAKSILFGYSQADYQLPDGVRCDTNYWAETDAQRMPNNRFYHFREETCYHVMRMNADGSGLKQLTSGPWNDFDPCFLPSGRIAFISTRIGGQARCGFRPDPTYTLHAMMSYGDDIIPLSYHETNEWQPSVDHDGMLAYTRWDYVDRDSDAAHAFWRCFPDGRDPRAVHGNYPVRRESRPWMVMSLRAVPGARTYVGVAAPHHGQAYGSLVLIDPRKPDDAAMAQVKRLTPEVLFPESESRPGIPHAKGVHSPNGEVYGTPWPLSEDVYLAVYDAGRKNYGIYLIDSFGNRECLYRDESISCLDPIPLKPRPRPPVLPVKTTQAAADRPVGAPPSSGTVMIMNVYDSARAWPKDTKITALRVVSLFPKDNSVSNEPNIGAAAQSLARGVLGTAPVESDGSAYFRVPAGTSVYFQALDDKGLMVQTMRSATYLHPGESLSCAGCHEDRSLVARMDERPNPMALRRPPSELLPGPEGSFPLAFPRLVQPVLDRHCVDCHDKEKKAPGLRGDRFAKNGWSESFHALRKYAWGMSGGNGVALKERQTSIPGEDGARVSKLYLLLTKGHHDVKLPPADLARITLWLDCNSNFYGAYHRTDEQARGGLVMPKEGLPEWLPAGTLAR